MKVTHSLLILIAFLLLGVMATETTISGDAGVGIMPSQIEVDESLLPGGYRVLPSLQVINTGDQTANYEVHVTSLQEQNEMKPDSDYFAFYPSTFALEPGANQVISISLNIPINAEPGDYLGLIEAHPQNAGKMVDISIAAAAQIYFTVKPANFMQASWVWFNSFIERHEPLSYMVPLVILIIFLLILFRRNLKVEFKIARRRQEDADREKS